MKKALLLILTIAIAILPLSACKKNNDEYSVLSYWVDAEGDVQGADGDKDSNASGTTSGGSTTGGNSATGGNSNTGGNSTTGGSSKPVSTNLSELKGKTYTVALDGTKYYTTTAYKAAFSAFESKYGCKFEYAQVEFNEYVAQISRRQSTGDPYDLLFIHGSFFPSIVIANACENLSSAIDTLKPKNTLENATSKFNWKVNGKMGTYGICNSKSLNPYVCYYNKVMFEDAGLEDPLELYNKGQWTWDKILAMGRQVADTDTSGAYFIGKQFNPTCFMGESACYIDEQGRPVNNLRSPVVKQAFEILQKTFTGNKPIGMPGGTTTEDYISYFPKGMCYMVFEETSKYADLAPAAKKSLAMGKSEDNLGIVPFPENSKHKYPTGWYTAFGAGTGADPRLPDLWADFQATYESPVKSSADLKGDKLTLVNNLLKKDMLPNRHGAYQGSGEVTSLSLYDKVRGQICTGTEITKAINDIVPQIDACMEATVGKGNYISK